MFNKRIWGFVFVLVLSLVPNIILGQELKQVKMDEQVKKANNELVEAEVKGDRAAMDRLFADDFTHTHATGVIETKAEFMKRFNPTPYNAIHLRNDQVRLFGNTATIVGHVVTIAIHDDPASTPGDSVFLAVWVQQQGTWRCAAWVTSRVVEQVPSPATTR